MSQGTHVPVRRCIGCGERAPQRELLRFSRSVGGGLEMVGRTSSGRSGYLHRREVCWQQFSARKGLVRSLGCTLDRAARVAFVQELKRAATGAIMMR